jgi:hypothetical protein
LPFQNCSRNEIIKMRQESPGRPLAALGNVKQARLAIGMEMGSSMSFTGAVLSLTLVWG